MRYNLTMPKPTQEEAVGYDLVIWLDEDGDPILSPYSELGAKYVKSLVPHWDGEKDVVIQTNDPELFMAGLPLHLFAGIINPSNNVLYPVKTKCLQ